MDVEERAAEVAVGGANRRSAPRLPVDGPATLLVVKHDCRVPCRVTDLSMGGCRIETGQEFRVGIQARVEVSFTVNGLLFRLNGVTQWTDGKHKVGVRFAEMTARRKDELTELLGEVEQENAAKAAERAAKQKAAEEQAARERAEAEAQEQARLAAEVLSLPPLQSMTNPAKLERRAQSRHAVDTSAVIYLVNVGSKLQGRIQDLSLGGCRIRTDEKFPVGIYTRVETEFQLAGLPFRLGGVIQAVHDRDRLNVGIRFLDMSDRKRGQVEQLIEEIEAMREDSGPGGEFGEPASASG
jgi:c-di-GMP-binding flagellar brake protein YcgR